MLLTLMALLAAPVAASASSGLPATLTMYPEAAGPGATVELVGLDFPAAQSVAVELAAAGSTAPMLTATTEDGGYFRAVLTLPSDLAPGSWELRAAAADGSAAAHAFVAVPAAADAAAAASGGNSASDIVVMLVVAALLAAVGGGGALAWRLVRDETSQPGMGAGDDLIWSGTAEGTTAELTAAEQPAWPAATAEG
jgi:hypothetical protein